MTTKFQIGDRVVTLKGAVGTVVANTVSAEGVRVLVAIRGQYSIDENKLRLADETAAEKIANLADVNISLSTALSSARAEIAELEAAARAAARATKPAKSKSSMKRR